MRESIVGQETNQSAESSLSQVSIPNWHKLFLTLSENFIIYFQLVIFSVSFHSIIIK